jgi:TRAP-type C4-dicarboxylate transport system substrate-binding protein
MSQSFRIGRAIVTVVAAALLLGANSGAWAAEYTMKIGFGTFKDVQHHWADALKEAIEKRSQGRIEVQVFPRNQLGPTHRSIEGVQLGTIEAYTAPADFFAGIDPRFGVFSIPVLFNGREHAAAVIGDAELNKEIRQIGDDKGLQVVSVFTHSVAHYLAKDPMRRLDDFKGKKLRVNATAAEREKMRRFGAAAVPMDLPEVVPSIQRGVIDGTMSGTVVYVVFKFNQVGKVLTVTNDTMIVSVGVVSKAWLEGLPADLRQIVIEEGARLQSPTSTFSHQSEDAMIAKWRELGGELVQLPPGDMATVRSMLASVGDDVTKDNSAVHSFYQRVKAVAAKY